MLKVWQANGLKPQLVETFKVSPDPKFVEKLEDVVGLYMSPPEHALVLCCNVVERFFRSISTDRLERGVFRSIPELITAIDEYIAVHNQNLKPFIWTAKADDILQKVIRANRKLGSKKNEALHSLH